MVRRHRREYLVDAVFNHPTFSEARQRPRWT